MRNTGDRLQRIDLADGSSIKAEHFVFALGPWLGNVFPNVIGDRVLPTRQEIHYFGMPAASAEAFANLPVWVDFRERLFHGIPSVEARRFKVADDTRGAIRPDLGRSTGILGRPCECPCVSCPTLSALEDQPLIESRVCQYENSPDGHYILDRHPEAENTWLLGAADRATVSNCALLSAKTPPAPYSAVQRRRRCSH